MKKNINSSILEKKIHSSNRVRSFVRRQSRMSKRQGKALNTLWSMMGIDYQTQYLDFELIFGRSAPVTLEIGFGMGISLVDMATIYPDQDFIGVEVYLPGIGACLARAHDAGVSNLRLIYHDAVEVLENMIKNRSLKQIQLFFPDPWHKIKHNKRRIIQIPFIELIKCKLIIGGTIHITTDCKSYAKHILKVMSLTDSLRNLSVTGNYVPRPQNRPITKFEERGHRLGHDIWELMFENCAFKE